MEKLTAIFISAFVLNWIWENLHSRLYLNYRGREITQRTLIRASFVDATFITAVSVIFIEIPYFKLRLWYSLFIGFFAATSLEIYALKTGRWKYNGFMPIIPIIKTGLTPTIQLGLLSYLIYSIAR
ncbi:MAG: hypothetical protein KGJ58_04595 [Patescibacteria group bacterium]|nr:hypothetical protein [Patescibacteria group bacterium]MDE1988697.1 hypothetical protein [Patescibacteria group bacterium]MDE2218690.1 hypothetical protein [Patescibacteria group bacterium]